MIHVFFFGLYCMIAMFVAYWGLILLYLVGQLILVIGYAIFEKLRS